ncbi:MAG: hypothetical protein WCL00_05175 [Bacteroidota bacterium]
MKTIVSLTGQTLYDIALQEMGSAEGVFDILELNPLLRLDIAIPTGTNVFVPDTVIKPAVVDYYTRNSIHPVSDNGAEVVYIEKNADIIQIVGYSVSNGTVSLNGIGPFDINNIKGVIIDYSLDLNTPCFLQGSDDGSTWTDIPDTDVMLSTSASIHAYTLTGIESAYIRVCLGPGTVEGEGTINKITYQS